MEKSLLIKQTKKTPLVIIDKDQLKIIGRSMPEDTTNFYKPIFDKIVSSKKDSITAHIDLEYFNSTSSKCMYNLIYYISNNFKESNINWYHDVDDDDMVEYIEDFEKSIGIKIKKIGKNESNQLF